MNEETFDWKQAAKYWGEGNSIQYKNDSSMEWEDIKEQSYACFEKDFSYRLRPEPVMTDKQLPLSRDSIDGIHKMNAGKNDITPFFFEKLVKQARLALDLQEELIQANEDLETISRWDKNYRDIAIEQIEKVHVLEQVILECKELLERIAWTPELQWGELIKKSLASISALNLGERNER